MVCIIVALREEIELFLEKIKILNTKDLHCGRQIIEAEHKAKKFLIAIGGVGKVHAAVTMQYVLDNYKADSILNIGVAGGFSKILKKNDILIAEAAYQHDFDVSLSGSLKKGQIPGIEDEIFFFDKESISELKNVCGLLGLEPKTGIVATGDCFVGCKNKVKELNEVFGAIACEMEAAALLQAAALNNFKRIAAVKLISDNADENALEDIQDFNNSKEIIKKILLKYIETL